VLLKTNFADRHSQTVFAGSANLTGPAEFDTVPAGAPSVCTGHNTVQQMHDANGIIRSGEQIPKTLRSGTIMAHQQPVPSSPWIT
jgi:hypothetical protein